MFIEADGEQMMRLDQLQPLVHHRRAIDADLCAHIPIGVRDGLCRRDGAHLIEAEGAERPAAGGQRDFADLADLAACEALEDSVMF